MVSEALSEALSGTSSQQARTIKGRRQMARPAPLAFRLPPDLHAAIEDMAANAGVTVSEWVRDMLHRIVYGEPPGIDAGYIQGRSLGFRVVHLAFRDAWERMPTNIEDALAMITAGNPHEQRNNED
jgi:hypothetical protein